MRKSHRKRFLTWPKLFILALLLGITVMSGWVILRGLIVKQLAQSINDLETQGYQIGHEGLNIRGFPFYMNIESDKVMVRAPASTVLSPDKNWTINTQDIHVRSNPLSVLSWTLKHRGNMRIDMRPSDKNRYLFEIIPADLTIKVKAGFAGIVKDFDVDLAANRLSPLIGSPPGFAKTGPIQFGLHAPGRTANYAIRATDLVFAKNAAPVFETAFGPHIQEIEIVGEITDWPILQKQGLEVWKNTAQIKARSFSLIWGKADIKGDFQFAFVNGLPEGTIRFRIQNLNDLYGALVNVGLVDANYDKQIRAFISVLDQDEEGRSHIELSIQGGVLKYGFLTLHDFNR